MNSNTDNIVIKKLPDGLNNFLDSLDTKYNFDKLLKSKSYKTIMNTVNQINDELISNNISSSELNEAIQSYDKDNKSREILDKLKKFSLHKNRLIYVNMYRKSPWLKCIKNLKSKYPHCRSRKLENGLITVLKKYKYNWQGFWSLVKYDDSLSYDVNEISIIDFDDIQTFNHFIHS
jgi:hypothetical protein